MMLRMTKQAEIPVKKAYRIFHYRSKWLGSADSVVACTMVQYQCTLYEEREKASFLKYRLQDGGNRIKRANFVICYPWLIFATERLCSITVEPSRYRENSASLFVPLAENVQRAPVPLVIISRRGELGSDVTRGCQRILQLRPEPGKGGKYIYLFPRQVVFAHVCISPIKLGFRDSFRAHSFILFFPHINKQSSALHKDYLRTICTISCILSHHYTIVIRTNICRNISR
jgi:hypothetical protein